MLPGTMDLTSRPVPSLVDLGVVSSTRKAEGSRLIQTGPPYSVRNVVEQWRTDGLAVSPRAGGADAGHRRGSPVQSSPDRGDHEIWTWTGVHGTESKKSRLEMETRARSPRNLDSGLESSLRCPAHCFSSAACGAPSYSKCTACWHCRIRHTSLTYHTIIHQF